MVQLDQLNNEREARDNRMMITIKDAALYMGIAKGTLDKWRMLRGPQYIRISTGRIGYRIADLDTFIEAAGNSHTL